MLLIYNCLKTCFSFPGDPELILFRAALHPYAGNGLRHWTGLPIHHDAAFPAPSYLH